MRVAPTALTRFLVSRSDRFGKIDVGSGQKNRLQYSAFNVIDIAFRRVRQQSESERHSARLALSDLGIPCHILLYSIWFVEEP